jgi:glucan phosphoethanolaminetransferase (alkaline phosphatase superfamily)
LTGTTTLPDIDRQALKNPTLFQYARQYGYETTILDVPGSNFPNIVIRDKDLQDVDHLFRANDLPGDDRFLDQRAIPVIHTFVKKERGQFIVLVKKGAHFHYETSYPRELEQFSRHKPRLHPYESYDSSRKKMINSYKNALSFTVDEFARKLFQEQLSNITILWTSDHGQSLQEHGQTYTHCKSDLEQAIVPLLLYSDHPWTRDLKPLIGHPGGIITSHHNLYPTIIALMSGEKDFQNEGYYSLFSNHLKQHDLEYLYGGIWTQSRIMKTFPQELEQFFH